jgi:tRNA threonylcarbamoyl adenosine modification protein (Sua5/YciO/YrdC/YwlC family)
MATAVVRLVLSCEGSDPQGTYADAIREASEVLERGGLVAFPTETVYGLGARADHAGAMGRLRAVKSREPNKAFTVHIAAREDAARFVPGIGGLAGRFVRKGWPGPLTLVMTVDDPSSAPVMVGRNGAAAEAMYYDHTIGLRCPDDGVAQRLLRAVDAPIVAASANLAGNPPPRSGAEVLRDLDGKIDLLIDSGRTKYAKPSTIVRVTGSSYEVVREGVYDAGIVERLSTVRLLFVCTGNTCRSPMAAGLAEQMLAERLGCKPSELRARSVVVQSAGTGGGTGGASPHAIKVMAQRGIDLSDHVSTALSAEVIQQSDYIFAMMRTHRDTIVQMVPAAESRVMLLLGNDDVRDPMGGAEEDYERCAQTVERGLRTRLQEVIV